MRKRRPEKAQRGREGSAGVCNHANLLTGKLWCTECGQPYYRRESEDKSGRKNSKWLCSGKIKNGSGFLQILCHLRKRDQAAAVRGVP